MNISRIDSSALAQHLASGAFSKDALIEAHRVLFGHVGDTARTNKGEYAARLAGVPDRAKLLHALGIAEDSEVHAEQSPNDNDEGPQASDSNPNTPNDGSGTGAQGDGEQGDGEADAQADKPQAGEQSEAEQQQAQKKKAEQAGEQLKDAIEKKRKEQRQKEQAAGQSPINDNDPMTQHIRRIANDEGHKVFAECAAPLMQAFVAGMPTMPKQEAAANAPAGAYKKIIIRDGKKTEITDHTHPVFGKVVKLVAAGLNVMLVGPAGCGKTHLGAQIAKALEQEFSSNSLTAGTSESEIFGWLLPTGDGGKFEYQPAPFVTRYETGGVHLFDEMDAMDANVGTGINSALANGSFYLAKRLGNPKVTRHEKFGCIAAANTFGNGADMVYVGRNQLDAATLDRFYVVAMDYDREFEKQCAPKDVIDFAENARKVIVANRMRRVISTRFLQKAATAMECGLKWPDVRADLLAGWTKDELAKVGA